MLFIWLLRAICVKYFPSNDGKILSIEGGGEVKAEGVELSGKKELYIQINVINATSIANAAFKNLPKLQSITMTDTVLSIGNNAFGYCYSLTEFTFPPNIERIEDYTFIHCHALRKVVIPKTVTYIAFSYTFCACNSLKEFDVDPDNTVFSCDSNKRFIQNKLGNIAYLTYVNDTVTFPAHITEIATFCLPAVPVKEILFESGSRLTNIRLNAFYQIHLQKEFKLPHGLKTISGAMFAGSSCPNISFPNTIETFDTSALNGISGLERVTLWEGDGGALSESNGVIYSYNKNIIFIPHTTEILDIPPNITEVSQSVVTTTASLKEVNVSKDHEKYSSYNGILYNKEGTDLIASPANLTDATIIDKCTDILSKAFSGTNIQTVKFGKNPSLKKIQPSAFGSCRKLKSFDFSEGIEKIQSYSFQTSSLSGDIILPSTLNELKAGSFSHTNIESVDLTRCSKITKLEGGLFGYCPKLSSVKLPPSIEHIEAECFYQTAIVSLEIPNTIKYIEPSCFCDCSKLSSFTFEKESQLSALNSSVLMSCNLSKIIIPKSVVSLMGDCLRNNPFLSEVSFEEGALLESIGPSIFAQCNSLKSFEIPSNVKSLSTGAFANTYALTNLTSKSKEFSYIDGIIYSPNKDVLICCAGGVKEADIPGSVSTIATQAFKDCAYLESVVFEPGCDVKRIEGSTFFGCIRLLEIEIPAPVCVVDSLAFNGCTSLKYVRFSKGSSLEELGSSAFKSCQSLISVEFNYSNKNDNNRQNSEPHLKKIGANAFEGCIDLSYINLPTFVLSIDGDAFLDCISLISINLGESLIYLGNSVFKNCSKLCSIRIPAGVEYIGSGCFNGCKSLSKFFYCGLSLNSTNIFDQTFKPVVFVPIGFAGTTLSDIKVVRMLDEHCMVPTSTFTAETNFLCASSLLSVSIAASASSED